jgi:hypothetical protein
MSKGPTLLKDLGWEGEELKQSRKYRNYVPLYMSNKKEEVKEFKVQRVRMRVTMKDG